MGKNVTDIVAELVTPILNQENLELVDIEYLKEGNNWFLRVYIDKENGIDIEDCGLVSEQLSKRLDEVDPIPSAYFLEISSPGIERPLKKEKDYQWSIGKQVVVKTNEPIGERKTFEGILAEFDGETLKVKEDKELIEIPFLNIESARLSVVF